MNIRLKFWQKILLSLLCFGIATYFFILKLPSAFRGYDKELHSLFYFLAAAFLNILFAKRNVFIHALIFGGLYIFGMAIEHGQVWSKKKWQIPHGRYDPEDVHSNLMGLLLFSAVWLVFVAIYFLIKKANQPSLVDSKGAEDGLIYEDEGDYFLLDYSSSHSEMVIRRINKSDPANIYNIDLFFKAVHDIHMPTRMENIRISKVSRKSAPFFNSNLYDRQAIYQLTDKHGNSAYIDAGVFIVFHNELDFLSSPLGDFTWSKGNKEILSSTIEGR